MIRLGFRYLWFKVSLAVGSVLGLVLLYQSFSTYYQVSRGLVIEDLRREASRQADSLVRLARESGIREPAELGDVLEEILQESPNKIAWFQVIDAKGQVLLQKGKPVGVPPEPEPERPPEGAERRVRAPDIRKTDEGEVLVTVNALRRRLPPPAGAFGRGPLPFPAVPGLGREARPQQVQLPARGSSREPERVSDRLPRRGTTQDSKRVPSQALRTEPGQQPRTESGPFPGRGLAPGLRLVEALYLKSASANFGPLITNLIINSSAALGLVASMVLLWFRFPHYVNGKRLEKETELARQVQMDLLPPAKFTVPHMDFAAECIPAWQVGGDFYDVFSIGDGRVAMALGDVSGKGLPASVVVGLLLGALRASNWLDGGAAHEASSTRLSELIRARTALERFASLFWCSYEPGTGALQYVNAGHLPPMLVRRSANGEAEVRRLEEGGPVLGVVPGATYTQGMETVREGDLLVIYSDGVVEATNSSGTQFDDEGLRGVIVENLDRSSTDIRDAILAAVEKFLGDERAQDDITLVVARFLKEPGGAA